jgi:hypothetical protein
MKAEESLALIAYRLERSSESLRAAEIMFENNMLYNKAFEYRQRFDYIDFSCPDREIVSEYLEKTKGFIHNIQEYLRRENVFLTKR